MTGTYEALLQRAQHGDPDAIAPLLDLARARDDPRGVLIATLFGPPSDEAWAELYTAARRGGAGDDLDRLASVLDARWPDHLRSIPVELPEGPLIEALTTTPTDPVRRRLARCLDLSEEALDETDVARLGASEHLAWVRVPRLRRCGLGESHARVLARADLVARLHTLDLADNPLGPAGVEALAGLPGAALETLGLAATRLGADGIRALARAAPLPALVSLDLRDNHGGVAGARAVAASPWRGLRELRLGDEVGGDTTEGTFQAIAEAPALANLEVLDLANHLGLAEGARALARSPYLTRLRRLDLTSAWIGDDGAAALATAPGLGQLAYLSLMTNDLHDAGLVALVGSSALPSLRTLRLELNDFTAAGIEALIQSPRAAQWRDLSLTVADVEAARRAVFAPALSRATRVAIFRAQPEALRRAWAEHAGLPDAAHRPAHELEAWIG